MPFEYSDEILRVHFGWKQLGQPWLSNVDPLISSVINGLRLLWLENCCFSFQSQLGERKKKRETSRRIRNRTFSFFLSFFPAIHGERKKKNSDSGLGDEVFFLLFLVLQLQSSSIERPAPRYSRAPFSSDFYRCRSQIRKREMRHLVRREPRKDFHSIQSIAESKWNCLFFFFLFLSLFFFLSISRCVHELAAFLCVCVVGLSVLFSERNHSTLAISCPVHLAHSLSDSVLDDKSRPLAPASAVITSTHSKNDIQRLWSTVNCK